MQIRSQTSLAAREVRHRQAVDLQTRPAGEGRGRGAVRRTGRGLRAAGLCPFRCAGWGCVPEVLKCKSAAAGLAGPRRCYRRRRGAEADSSGSAWRRRRQRLNPKPRRGPAVPARGRLGRGGGRWQPHRRPAPWPPPPRGWAPSPPPEPARLHSGRRLLPHPLQHVVYPVILDHHCAGRKRVSRAARGAAARMGPASSRPTQLLPVAQRRP